MQAIFQPVLHNEKWWYVIPMAPRTKPLFQSLLPELGQVDVHFLTDTYTLDQRNDNTMHPSIAKGTGVGPSWVATQLLYSDQTQIETGNLFDVVDDDEGDPDLAADSKPVNTDAFVDLCIKLGRFWGHD
jgi:hypothetical protein